MPPELYSRQALQKLSTDGPLPPEILPLLKFIPLEGFARLPDSMQTKAYRIHTVPRFPYPCAPASRSCAKQGA